jgi:NAD(P)-dependent dehydrogenase (short-subunit alcohol dehydrogenase family)
MAEKDRTRERLGERFQTLNALSILWAEPVDISTLCPWLVSEESPYVTGVTLPVDAGSLIKQPLSQLCKEE